MFINNLLTPFPKCLRFCDRYLRGLTSPIHNLNVHNHVTRQFGIFFNPSNLLAYHNPFQKSQHPFVL